MPRDLPDYFALPETPASTPRLALEAVVEPMVRRSPCYVLFSGGRDSSAVLALALAKARSISADDPVPVMVRHPDARASHETDWQELVLRHLGITNFRVLNFRGEQAWLSEAAQESLTKHGLLWPPAVQLHGAVYRNLSSGALLSGEGGDMSIEAHGVAVPLNGLRALKPRTTLAAMIDLVRARRRARGFAEALVSRCWWLTEAGAEHMRRTLYIAPEPPAWDRALHQIMSGRLMRVASANFHAMAEAWGLEPLNPLEHPRFIAALIRSGRWHGMGSRTDMMRRLFGDLLPDSILSRTTKASFNQTRWTASERLFAESWTGAGVDQRLTDVDRLRKEWAGSNPFTLSAYHLHAAWVADNNLASVHDGT